MSEEDRSRNVIIFGLKINDTDEEHLTERVDELFQQIELKPRFEAVRFGRKLAEKTKPVRILEVELFVSRKRLQNKFTYLRHCRTYLLNSCIFFGGQISFHFIFLLQGGEKYF